MGWGGIVSWRRDLCGFFLHSVLFLLSPAWGQSSPDSTDPHSASASTSQLRPPVTTRLDPVTVTAQRREESARNVPISIEVFSEQNLQDRGARRTTDLFESTPNVNFTSVDSGVGGANMMIRGVGSVVVQNLGQGVGFYVDDVFVGTPRTVNTDLLDLDRVEILRGPQGTLYGRNTLGGAIHLVSTPPDETLAATLDTEFGNYAFRKVRASTNIPLVKDTLSSRFAFTYTERDGTVFNRFGGQHINTLGNIGGRMQFRFRPAPDVEIHFTGDYSHDDVMRSALGPFAAVIHQRVNLARPPQGYRDLYGATGKLIITRPDFILTAITGFRGVVDKNHADFTPLNPSRQRFNIQQQQVSQELRLQSPSGNRLRWVGGLFYYHEKGENELAITLPQALAGGLPPGYQETSRGAVVANSYAMFADLTYPLWGKLSVTTGVRFSYDEKDLNYRHVNSLGIPGVFAPAQKAQRQAVFNNWSPRFVVTYQWTERLLTYASISRGYKSGAFNTLVVNGSRFKFLPETAWNYEVGLKATLWDERAQLNLAAFYFDWQKPQASIFNGTFTTTANASRARSFGSECTLLLRPLTGWDISAGIGYADATFRRFDNFVPGRSAAGHRVPFSSKFSATAAVQYRVPLTTWMMLMARGEMAYKSSLFYDIANTLKEPGYALVNLRMGLESERWDLFVFARNTLNERYRTTAFYWPSGPVGAPGDPRTYGVQARVRF